LKFNMTIETKDCNTAAEALDFLRGLALDPNHQFYFRGHRDETWRLQTTYSRHRLTPHAHWMPDLQQMIDHFIGSLLSARHPLPFVPSSRRGKLEYARHYGLPTPVLDWSFSPYVATFFAFNGTRRDNTKRAVVYALNLIGLADLYAQTASRLPGGGIGPHYLEFFHEFASPPDFEKEYPGGALAFMPAPASWNTRMIRQMGTFLYDTMDYESAGWVDLDDFVERNAETAEQTKLPTLYKVFIPLAAAPEAFSLLDIAGMTGIRLLDDYEGAVADTVNAYNYNRKSGYFWDLAEDNVHI
jgi:FRG domain